MQVSWSSSNFLQMRLIKHSMDRLVLGLHWKQLQICFAMKQRQASIMSFDPYLILLIPSKIVIRNHIYPSGFRYYASEHDSVRKIWSMKRFIKNEEKRVAAQIFQHHLHEHKGLSIADAAVISKNSPAFLRKLIILSKNSKTLKCEQSSQKSLKTDDDGIRLRIEKALNANLLNEWESVVESIGIPPEKVCHYLHLLEPGLVGDHIFLKNLKILEDCYVPRRKLGNIFYSQNGTLMNFSPVQLSANVGNFEWLGIKRDQLGPMVQKYPEMLGLDIAEVLRPALNLLKELLVNRKVLGRLLVHSPRVIVEDPTLLLRKVEFLVKCGMTKDYIASILKKNPEIMLSNLMDQNLMLFSCRLS